MDLKTYAVHRKLLADDDLLSYVAKGEPVPVFVIENSFQGFLSQLADETSESLVTNYPKMLHENVPVVINPSPETGGYEVSGDIPDAFVDAIAMVHGVEPDDIAAALVNYGLSMVHGQAGDILSISLGERAERTLADLTTFPGIVPASEDLKAETVGGEPFPEESGRSEFFDEAPIKAELPRTEPKEPEGFGAVEPIGENGSHAQGVFEMGGEEELPMEENPGAHAQGESAVEESFEEPVMEKSFDKSPDVFDEGELLEEENDAFSRAIRSIYEKFCADIRAYGLDSRLNLNLA